MIAPMFIDSGEPLVIVAKEQYEALHDELAQVNDSVQVLQERLNRGAIINGEMRHKLETLQHENERLRSYIGRLEDAQNERQDHGDMDLQRAREENEELALQLRVERRATEIMNREMNAMRQALEYGPSLDGDEEEEDDDSDPIGEIRAHLRGLSRKVEILADGHEHLFNRAGNFKPYEPQFSQRVNDLPRELGIQ